MQVITLMIFFFDSERGFWTWLFDLDMHAVHIEAMVLIIFIGLPFPVSEKNAQGSPYL